MINMLFIKILLVVITFSFMTNCSFSYPDKTGPRFFNALPKSILAHLVFFPNCADRSHLPPLINLSKTLIEEELKKRNYQVEFGRDIDEDEYSAYCARRTNSKKWYKYNLDCTPLFLKIEKKMRQEKTFDSVLIVGISLVCQEFEHHEIHVDRVTAKYWLFDIQSKQEILLGEKKYGNKRKRKNIRTLRGPQIIRTTFQYAEPIEPVVERAMKYLFSNLPDAELIQNIEFRRAWQKTQTKSR